MTKLQRGRTTGPRTFAPVLLVGAAIGLFAFVGASGADVSAVSGSAYGASVNLNVAGVGAVSAGPLPTVTLPASGGNESASLATISVPPFLTTGLAEVSTQGTTGAGGSSTSSARLVGVSALAGNLTADVISSACTASETDISGSSTLTNAMLRLTDGDPTTLDVSPAPNTTLTGNVGGQSFSVILNEQIETADAITVNAVHITLNGPLATGDIILSQSHCDIVRAAGTTTSTEATTSTTEATTTTTEATTTTTQATTTTTRQPRAKCNAGRGNGSEIDPATGRDCDPGNSGGRNQGGD